MIQINKVGILYNPISGKGIGLSKAQTLREVLIGHSFQVVLIESRPLSESAQLKESLQGIDCLIILGGDGTLMSMLGILIRMQTPTYIMPFGNECLCSRECGMSEDNENIVSVLRRGQTASYSIGKSNEQYFFTMLSAGFDADVIRDISSKRSGPVTKLTYTLSVLKLAFRHKSPRLSVYADNRCLIDSKKGFVIVGKTKHYALGINFAAHAIGTSSDLYLYFYPYRTVVGFIYHSLKMLLSINKEKRADKYFLGTHSELRIEPSSDEKYAVQADGEYLGSLPVQIVVSRDRLLLLK